MDSRSKAKKDLQHTPESGIKFGIGISSQRSYVLDNIGKNRKTETWDVLKTIDTAEKRNDTIYCILHNALCLLHSEESLNKISKTHAKVSRILPTFIADHEQMQVTEKVDDGSYRLKNILLSFGLNKHEVPLDGDCLFTSVVLS